MNVTSNTSEQRSKKKKNLSSATFCPTQLKPAAVHLRCRPQGRWERKSPGVASAVFKEVPPKRSSQEEPYQRNAAFSERAQQLCNQLQDPESHGRAFLARKGQLCSQKHNMGSWGGWDALHQQTPIPSPALATRRDSVVENEIALLMQNYLLFV